MQKRYSYHSEDVFLYILHNVGKAKIPRQVFRPKVGAYLILCYLYYSFPKGTRQNNPPWELLLSKYKDFFPPKLFTLGLRKVISWNISGIL